MRRDKKTRGGRLRFVLPTWLGEARTVEDVNEREVVWAMQAIVGV
jgi:3-dehydroquinate synthetase